MARQLQTYYELLDVLPDAKRDEIALGYQRALESLSQEHDSDPKRRAALRKAFEVLADPIQRMSYDVSVLPRETTARFPDQKADDKDANGDARVGKRLGKGSDRVARFARYSVMGKIGETIQRGCSSGRRITVPAVDDRISAERGLDGSSSGEI